MKKVWIAITLLIALGLYLQERPEPEEVKKPFANKQELDESLEEADMNEGTPDQNDQQPTKKKLEVRRTTQLQKPKPTSSLGEDFVPFDSEGNRYITQINRVGKHLVYHGDLLVGSVDDLPRLKKQKVVKRAKPQKWPQGKIPFILDEDLSNYGLIQEAIEIINQSGHVTFIPREEQKNYVHFTFGESDCYSYAGMVGGKQEIFLTPQCRTKEILHEIMHTLGFLHEQNREDRDQYVEVLWENIEELNHAQFKKIPNTFLGISGRPFDYNSIMMYSSYTFARTRNEPTILTKDGDIIPPHRSLLSDEDIKRIQLAYP